MYFLALGFVLLLGGIAAQMVVGISTMGVTGEMERFGMAVMSRVSQLLIVAYFMVFVSGVVLWLSSPTALKKKGWFRAALLLFYIWLPVDIYTIVLDIRFARLFDLNKPLTEELKALHFGRWQTLGILPLLALLGYLVAIALVVFRPQFKKQTESHILSEGKQA